MFLIIAAALAMLTDRQPDWAQPGPQGPWPPRVVDNTRREDVGVASRIAYLLRHGRRTEADKVFRIYGTLEYPINKYDLQFTSDVLSAVVGGTHDINFRRGAIANMQWCLERGAVVDANDNNPLWTAAHSDATGDSVKFLLSKGARPVHRDRERVSHLAAAIRAGRPWNVQILLRHGADPNAWYGKAKMLPIIEAARAGDLWSLKRLVEAGARIDSRDPWNESTALHIAARLNHEEMVRYLLSKGADRNLKDENGLTPIEVAKREGGRRAVVEMLMSK
jgi:uncharacterized protein